MEYGTYLDDDVQTITSNCQDQIYNGNYFRYVGWEKSQCPNPGLEWLFSNENLNIVSKKITQLLQGVHPEGRDIIVPHDKIAHVFSQFLNNEPTNRELGDIYTRYNIINPQQNCPIESIIERSISVIVDDISNQFGMIENNKKLTIWTTILGDFNKHGLNSYSQSQITGAIRRKRPQTMAFNMNY